MTPDGFAVLYEEGPCLAVDKPAGLLTQAPPHIDSLEQRLRRYLQQRDAKPGRIYLGVPHRLDRPVSGVLLFARHVRAARRLSGQFERRMVDKRYVAWLEGELAEDAGEWVDHVGKVPDQARAEMLEAGHPLARLARLRFRVLNRSDGRTCVEIELDTGRYHQIRVQAGARQHPVVGDYQYGAQQPFGPPRSDPREQCIALHARRITFYHPMTHEARTVVAPLPAYWGGLEVP
ncbi:MAG: RNA pseudouridine synthase [Planctomycetaceae bacterium]|nr:RNA pseudouridine synthase [Planctomycetaceae bacterium]